MAYSLPAFRYGADGQPTVSWNEPNYQKYWLNCPNKTHVIGKGVNRFHTVYWPALLIVAGAYLLWVRVSDGEGVRHER